MSEEGETNLPNWLELDQLQALTADEGPRTSSLERQKVTSRFLTMVELIPLIQFPS